MWEGDKIIEVIEKVTKELENLGLTLDTVENEHILEACIAKVALVDNLKKEGIDFDELENKLYPDSTFVNQMIMHLDDGGSDNDLISRFLIKALDYSPELQDLFESP